MTPEAQWNELVEDWQEIQNAVLAFPLFTNGMMNTALLSEFERLREQEHQARVRMDEFLDAYR